MATIVNRNGNYSVVYYYKNTKGERKQKWEAKDSLKQAQKRKLEIEHHKERLLCDIVTSRNMSDFFTDYINIYGSKKWSLSTYTSNQAIIAKYLVPYLGTSKIGEVTSKKIDDLYHYLLNDEDCKVSVGVIYEIHKILHAAFNQAVKWAYIETNPAKNAILPTKYMTPTAFLDEKQVAYAIACCENPTLSLAIHLAFAGTMRIGEILALTWDDISKDCTQLSINKTLMRASDRTLEKLDNKDVVFIFPSLYTKAQTHIVLKKPKTHSSTRIIYLPHTVANLLKNWHTQQIASKKAVEGSEDYSLVFAQENGRPYSETDITKLFKKLIQESGLPSVVFHSLRHSSITYKLKVTRGNIKCVQGDSGHAQSKMVTDLYAHISDFDRERCSEDFENLFYLGNTLTPQIPVEVDILIKRIAQTPEGLEQLKNLLTKVVC